MSEPITKEEFDNIIDTLDQIWLLPVFLEMLRACAQNEEALKYFIQHFKSTYDCESGQATISVGDFSKTKKVYMDEMDGLIESAKRTYGEHCVRAVPEEIAEPHDTPEEAAGPVQKFIAKFFDKIDECKKMGDITENKMAINLPVDFKLLELESTLENLLEMMVDRDRNLNFVEMAEGEKGVTSAVNCLHNYCCFVKCMRLMGKGEKVVSETLADLLETKLIRRGANIEKARKLRGDFSDRFKKRKGKGKAIKEIVEIVKDYRIIFVPGIH